MTATLHPRVAKELIQIFECTCGTVCHHVHLKGPPRLNLQQKCRTSVQGAAATGDGVFFTFLANDLVADGTLGSAEGGTTFFRFSFALLLQCAGLLHFFFKVWECAFCKRSTGYKRFMKVMHLPSQISFQDKRWVVVIVSRSLRLERNGHTLAVYPVVRIAVRRPLVLRQKKRQRTPS